MYQPLRTTVGILSAAALVVSVTVLCAAPMRTSAQSVEISITVDADSVEIIRAWRRQQGLDPPDAQADERVVELLRRWQAERNKAAVAAPAEDAGDTRVQPAPRPKRPATRPRPPTTRPRQPATRRLSRRRAPVRSRQPALSACLHRNSRSTAWPA